MSNIEPDQVQDDDPNLREVAARALNTGRPVLGRVGDDGVLHMEELPPEAQEACDRAEEACDALANECMQIMTRHIEEQKKSERRLSIAFWVWVFFMVLAVVVSIFSTS